MLLSCAWICPTAVSTASGAPFTSATSPTSKFLVGDLVAFAPLSLATFLLRLTGQDCSAQIAELFGQDVSEVFFTHFIQLFSNPTSEQLRDAWLSTAAFIMPFNSPSVDCVIVVRVRSSRSAASSSSSSSSVADAGHVEYWPLWIQIKNYKYLSPAKMSEAMAKMTPSSAAMKGASSPVRELLSLPAVAAVPDSEEEEEEEEDVGMDDADVVQLEASIMPESVRGKKRKTSGESAVRCIRLVMSVRDDCFQGSSDAVATRRGTFVSLSVRGVPQWLPHDLRDALHSLCTDPRIPSSAMLRSRSSCDELLSCYTSQGLAIDSDSVNRDHDFSEPPSVMPL
jgi:hypothetical protein